MGFFGLFGKKDVSAEPPLKKRIKDMKLRKISYVDSDFSALVSAMKSDSKAILSLKPVNYYAVKNQYIMAYVYTTPEYEENYVAFSRYDFEHKTDESELFPIDRETLSKALAKVGIII